MKHRYGKKATEKIGRTMREFERGELKTPAGRKVTSRKQAIAIGVSQARRAGYKVPSQSTAHATMSIDARVRTYLKGMRPGNEIDARGIARALRIDPLEADYALARAAREGYAVSSDGRWYGPGSVAHATRRKSAAQLDREIAESLAKRLRDLPHDRVLSLAHALQWSAERDAAQRELERRRNMPAAHATMRLDKDDAVAFGKYAFGMGRTKAQALAEARAEGFVGYQMPSVEDGWDAARRDRQWGEEWEPSGIRPSPMPAARRGHATRRRGPSHSTKPLSRFAVEIDPREFDADRELPDGARWRHDLGAVAQAELARGRTYRRPKDARYEVIDWTGFRGAVGKLLDWMEETPGITRYAEVFE